jgi:Zn-dependent protease/CBS domain-containing protein
MGWSWRLGRVLGIDVFVHFTFLLLLAWVLIIHYFVRQNWGDALEEVLFIVIVFGTVLLHEFGHALAARRYGIPTRDITLLPIGGLARLERMPEDPKQELVVALAGPAVNVFLAAGLFLWLAGTGNPPTIMGHFAEFSDSLLVRLFHVNVWLVLFNLLPAFPMDGGRVLRALLAMRLDYVQATQIAASVGQGMALLFGFLGLFGNPLLIFIALFVWIGASQEASMVLMKSSLAGIPVSRAMVKDFRTVAPNESLQQKVQELLAGFQQDFPVLEGERIVGVLTRSDIVGALKGQGDQATVRDAMQEQFETAHPAEMLDAVLARIQAGQYHALPVVRDGNLVGFLTMDNVGEFLAFQAARRAGGRNGQVKGL